VANQTRSPTATIAMEEIDGALNSAIRELSDKNYAQSLGFCRFWFDVAQAYHQVPSDQILDAIWKNRGTGGINSDYGPLNHSTAHLILRFAGDVAELDHALTPHGPGLQNRLCTRSLQAFLSKNMEIVRHGGWVDPAMSEFYAGATFIAHLTNLGYVEEATIRNHILQSLISHPKLYDHQADALIILFKLAGATFGAYTDSSVVDRCFELLKGHSYNIPNRYNYGSYDRDNHVRAYRKVRGELVQVREPQLKALPCSSEPFQEVLTLRESGWEGLPPPPIFSTGGLGPTGVNQSDTAATPVATSLGLPNRNPEPQIPPPLPLESGTTPVPEPIPESPVTPVIQSPSISIATLSDFTIADTTDDEFPIGPTATDTSDEELTVDPTAVAQHETFYLEDGNVEVLCGNTLFRVHTTILSFHSPALRRMFAQANLATAESPNGCPRIPSSDTAKDFATLLKMIYFPGFVLLPCRHTVLLTICSSTDSPRGIKFQTSPHFHPSSGSLQSMRCPPSDVNYSRLSVMHTQRPSRDSVPPNRLGRASSVDGLPTRMRFSTSLSSRISRPRCRWHITWRSEGVQIL